MPTTPLLLLPQGLEMKRYGSILAGLQTHKIIDLLPERTVDSVVAWLEAHPEVGIVSRDLCGWGNARSASGHPGV